MSWHTSYSEDEVMVTIDRDTHYMDPESAKALAASITRMADNALRQKARRASEAAQTLAKQENARHQ